MNRDYDTGEKNDVTFFTGYEVEKTPAFDLKTLFVVGLQSVDFIERFYKQEECEPDKTESQESHHQINCLTHLFITVPRNFFHKRNRIIAVQFFWRNFAN